VKRKEEERGGERRGGRKGEAESKTRRVYGKER